MTNEEYNNLQVEVARFITRVGGTAEGASIGEAAFEELNKLAKDRKEAESVVE